MAIIIFPETTTKYSERIIVNKQITVTTRKEPLFTGNIICVNTLKPSSLVICIIKIVITCRTYFYLFSYWSSLSGIVVFFKI